ncbi:hypothetical protein Zmor_014541 [Zophobas morio]|uniref:Uncharacterized protein n=1 Tax=Zophobas morio TaxID=2755281 RepID=A0AA38IKV7_9CUCU|nr:hypothetical protein Zmor_014541 [Zophobas morio]
MRGCAFYCFDLGNCLHNATGLIAFLHRIVSTPIFWNHAFVQRHFVPADCMRRCGVRLAKGGEPGVESVGWPKPVLWKRSASLPFVALSHSGGWKRAPRALSGAFRRSQTLKLERERESLTWGVPID